MKRTLIATLAVLALASCAKDRTTDDYMHERQAQELAKITAISGQYRGSLVWTQDTSTLASFSLSVEPDTFVDTGSGQVLIQQKVTFKGDLTVQLPDGTRILPYRNGIYDDLSGLIRISTATTGRDGQIYYVDVSGTLSGEQLNGTVSVSGYEENGAKFALVRNGPVPSSANLRAGSAFVEVKKITGALFEGTAQSSRWGNFRVQMILSRSQASADQEFLDGFVPVQPIDVTLNVYSASDNGDPSAAFYKAALWDQRIGRISGEVDVTALGQSWKNDLNCDLVSGAWRCKVTTTNLDLAYRGTNVLFEADLKPASGGATP